MKILFPFIGQSEFFFPHLIQDYLSIGLLLRLLLTLLGCWLHSRLFVGKFSDSDLFTDFAFGTVSFFSFLTFSINLFSHFFQFSTASTVGAFSALILPLIFYKNWATCKNNFDSSFLILSIGCWLWAAYIIFFMAGIDFGKVHFPLAVSIIESNTLPHLDPTPLIPGLAYHYGHNLVLAFYSSVFQIPPHIGEDILPLFCSWTPLVAFKIIGLRLGIIPTLANRFALLVFFGTNIRLFFIVLMSLIALSTENLSESHHVWKELALITRDYDLNASTSLSQIEWLLLPASQLGFPIFLFSIALWAFPEKTKSQNSIFLLGFLLLSGQFLFREDYLLLTLGAIFPIYIFKYFRSPKFIIFFLGITLSTLLLGGLISETFKNKTGFSDSFEKQRESIDAANSVVDKFTFSAVPKVASLNIDVGRKKEILFHPQILLDLLLDYSLTILGLLGTLFVFKKWPPQFRWYFLFYFVPAGLMFFFANSTALNYKLDLQRMIGYNIWVLVGVSTLFLWKPNWFRSNTLLSLFILTNIVAGIVCPKNFQNECWRWFHPDLEKIGKHINSENHLKEGESIAGLNPGYTGRLSYAYLEDFLVHENNLKNDSIKRAFENNNTTYLSQAGVRYLVYPNDIFLDNSVYSRTLELDFYSLWSIKE